MCATLQQVVLCKSLRDTSGRLAELGWLHNKVRKYTDARSLDRAFGLVGQVPPKPAVCIQRVLVVRLNLFLTGFLSLSTLPPSELLCLAPPGAEGILQAAVRPPLTGTNQTHTCPLLSLYFHILEPLQKNRCV